MVLKLGFILTALGVLGSVSADNAWNIPECGFECCCWAGETTKISTIDREMTCRSAPFQLAMRECAQTNCSPEDKTSTETLSKQFCAENYGVDVDALVLGLTQQVPEAPGSTNVEGSDLNVVEDVTINDDGPLPPEDQAGANTVESTTVSPTPTSTSTYQDIAASTGGTMSSTSITSVAATSLAPSPTTLATTTAKSGSTIITTSTWMKYVAIVVSLLAMAIYTQGYE